MDDNASIRSARANVKQFKRAKPRGRFFSSNREPITNRELEDIIKATKRSLPTDKQALWDSLNRIARHQSWGRALPLEPTSEIIKKLKDVANAAALLIKSLETNTDIQTRLVLAAIAAEQGLLEEPDGSVARERAIAASLTKGEDRRYYCQLAAFLEGARLFGRLAASELPRTKANVRNGKGNYQGQPALTNLVNVFAIAYAMAWRCPPGTSPNGPFSRYLESCSKVFMFSRYSDDGGKQIAISDDDDCVGSKLVDRWKGSSMKDFVDEAVLAGQMKVLVDFHRKTRPRIRFTGRRWDRP